MLDFLSAIGLVLAIEGLLMAAFPAGMRKAVEEVIRTPDVLLRRVGIASAIIGIVVIYLARQVFGGE